MATADRKGGRKPMKGTPDHFEKLLEGPCPNHAFPIKRLYKDCVLIKRFLSTGDAEGKDSGFPTLDGCLMIFEGSATYDSKHRQKLACHEVYMIISMKRLTKVLMDGGSGLNIMYAKTLNTIGIDRARISSTGAPFHSIIINNNNNNNNNKAFKSQTSWGRLELKPNRSNQGSDT